jgi:hypothetical protein
MSELPPYTGHPTEPEPKPVVTAPVVPGAVAPPTIVWRSRVALIATGGFALLAGILTVIGGLNFPSGATIEGIYCFGLIVDLATVVIVIGALTIVEYVRRGVQEHAAVPVNTRPSIFAIVALGLSLVAAFAWAGGGGLEQLGYLLGGIRPRYMYATGTLFVAGIPWALGAIFGVLGFRPGGNRVTNALGLAAVAIWAILAVLTTVAALVYGADLSD